jgi:hypothetical protein
LASWYRKCAEAEADRDRPATHGRRLGLDERVRTATEQNRLLQMAKSGLNRGLSSLPAGDTIKARFVLELLPKREQGLHASEGKLGPQP